MWIVFAGDAQAQSLPGIRFSQQTRIERIADNHWRLSGNVEGEFESDHLKFAADVVDYFTDHPRRLVGTGHVVVITEDSHISADKADLNTETRTGVFYNAFGTVTVAETQAAQKSLFGTQEPIAYFYGDTIEKLGADRYRVSHGGFTTCVQPTPRWQLISTSLLVHVDRYAFLKNAVLKVKDVPLLYLPVMYYPIDKDERSTGFLMPIYGSSTSRGSSISNAFFWAISRSQDATFMHDWYTTTGQGYGAEYRYVTSPTSNGLFRFSRLEQKATDTTTGTDSFTIASTVVQKLPLNLTARGNVNYFSNVTVQQTTQVDLYSATLRNRTYGGNLSGSWGRDSVSATYQVSEVFYNATDSQVVGSEPRFAYQRAATPIARTPLLFSLSAESAHVTRVDKVPSSGVENDHSYSRLDATPTITYPFTHWSFLNVRSSVSWHNTYYFQSWDANDLSVNEPVGRQYLEMTSRILGPVFSKVWNTPDNSYAEKFKHVIEPEFTVSRTTGFGDYDKIPKVESSDYVYGDTTRYTYGVTQRLLAKRRSTGDKPGQSTEILNLSVQQSYYSNPQASLVDASYSTSYLKTEASNFSNVALTARVAPAGTIGATARLEYNAQKGKLETAQLNANVRVGSWLETSNGYSQRTYFDVLDPQQAFTNYLSSTTRVNFLEGKIGGSYDFQLNVKEMSLVQHRLGFHYNAQCCGVALEYQSYNYPATSAFLVPQDRRFSVTFTLAGVGTFSNLLGAFGIGQGANGKYGSSY
jgi:LPS-assembly protein